MSQFTYFFRRLYQGFSLFITLFFLLPVVADEKYQFADKENGEKDVFDEEYQDDQNEEEEEEEVSEPKEEQKEEKEDKKKEEKEGKVTLAVEDVTDYTRSKLPSFSVEKKWNLLTKEEFKVSLATKFKIAGKSFLAKEKDDSNETVLTEKGIQDNEKEITEALDAIDTLMLSVDYKAVQFKIGREKGQMGLHLASTKELSEKYSFSISWLPNLKDYDKIESYYQTKGSLKYGKTGIDFTIRDDTYWAPSIKINIDEKELEAIYGDYLFTGISLERTFKKDGKKDSDKNAETWKLLFSMQPWEYEKGHKVTLKPGLSWERKMPTDTYLNFETNKLKFNFDVSFNSDLTEDLSFSVDLGFGLGFIINSEDPDTNNGSTEPPSYSVGCSLTYKF